MIERCGTRIVQRDIGTAFAGGRAAIEPVQQTIDIEPGRRE